MGCDGAHASVGDWNGFAEIPDGVALGTALGDNGIDDLSLLHGVGERCLQAAAGTAPGPAFGFDHYVPGVIPRKGYGHCREALPDEGQSGLLHEFDRAQGLGEDEAEVEGQLRGGFGMGVQRRELSPPRPERGRCEALPQ